MWRLGRPGSADGLFPVVDEDGTAKQRKNESVRASITVPASACWDNR